jgi:hypothetical protein
VRRGSEIARLEFGVAGIRIVVGHEAVEVSGAAALPKGEEEMMNTLTRRSVIKTAAIASTAFAMPFVFAARMRPASCPAVFGTIGCRAPTTP